MNEYNHHRIIERVAHHCGISTPIKNKFIEASDFSDFFIGIFGGKLSEWKDTAKQKFFFYRFYYTINIKGSNTIGLNRIASNGFIGNNSKKCIKKAGDKGMDGKYSLFGWNSLNDEKEFFSSVNDRTRSPQTDMGDTANQSDNVAFLHAMGAEGEIAGDSNETKGAEGEIAGDLGDTNNTKGKTSRSIFEDHLKKCFAEYLFLEDEEEALFMLGIAFHGIMDSFTPSHMGFQKYAEQDMGLHAQGDVIPVMGKFNKDGELLEGNFSDEEAIIFDPGQFTKEIRRNQAICILKKRFGGNGYSFVNPVEYQMFKIFFYISDVQEVGCGGFGDIDTFLKRFHRLTTINQINHIIRNGNYRYGPKSYTYSEAAIKVISDIYMYLCNERLKCTSYAFYKKEKETIIAKALNYWIGVYDGKEKIKVKNCKEEFSMKTIRDEHLKLHFGNPQNNLYNKDSDLDERFNKYKESNEYKEWVAQQNIDRLNSEFLINL